MSISVSCPGCGKTYSVPKTQLGQNAKCKKCGESFLLQTAEHKLEVRHAASLEEIIVTTGDLKQPYDVIGPVYFQVSNKGIFSSQLKKLKSVYEQQIHEQRQTRQIGMPQVDWGFLYGEWSVGSSDFEAAFFISVQELRGRANSLNADAIIAMRQDIDLDTDGFAFFYLQMYGTAVRFCDAP